MNEFAKFAEPTIKELGLDYTNEKDKIFENLTIVIYNML